MKRIVWIAFVLACGPDAGSVDGSDADTTGSATTGGDPTTAASTVTSPGTATSATTSTTTTATTTTDTTDDNAGSTARGSSEEGSFYIQDPDGGSIYDPCDVWGQDCPPGERCTPWALSGDARLDGARCSPIVRDPQHVGDPCTMLGGVGSGIDDCDASSFCWDVDPDTGQGVCVAYCTGSEADPSCEDPATSCAILSPYVIPCLPCCDALVQDCPGGACVLTENGTACNPDAGGNGSGAGEPCVLDSCAPGLFCAPNEAVPGCVGEACCAAFCDVTAADPCPGAAEGVTCVPLFPKGGASSCASAELGGCVLAEGGP